MRKIKGKELVAVEEEESPKNRTGITTPISPVEYFEYLDGLRGWASFIVCLFHFQFIVGIGSWLSPWLVNFIQTTPFHLLLDGRWAVHVFFILSGRVLMASAMRKSDLRQISSAAIRRPFRLAFPIVGTLFLYHLLHRNYLEPEIIPFLKFGRSRSKEWLIPTMEGATLNIFELLRYSLSMFLFVNERYHTVLPGGVGWTLTLEFWGSMAIYMAAAIHFPMKNKIFFPLCMAILLIWRADIMALFFVGYLLCALKIYGWLNLGKITRTILILLLIRGFIIWTYPQNVTGYSGYEERAMIESTFNRWVLGRNGEIGGIPPKFGKGSEGGFWFHALVSGTILILLLDISPMFQKLFSNRFSRWLGYISFSMYLCHGVMAAVITCWFMVPFKADPNFKSYMMKYPYFSETGAKITIAFSIGTLFVSWILTKLIDQPSIHLTKWLYDFFIVSEESWVSSLLNAKKNFLPTVSSAIKWMKDVPLKLFFYFHDIFINVKQTHRFFTAVMKSNNWFKLIQEPLMYWLRNEILLYQQDWAQWRQRLSHLKRHFSSSAADISLNV